MGMSPHSAAPRHLNGNGPAHATPRVPVQQDPEFLESAPELVGALKGGSPRFAHVALASYLARRPDVPEADRALLRRSFPDMFERFERSSGRIVSWYMATEVFAAAALTDKDGISVTLGRELPPGSAELVDLIRRCQQVAYSAWHRLNQFDRSRDRRARGGGRPDAPRRPAAARGDGRDGRRRGQRAVADDLRVVPDEPA